MAIAETALPRFTFSKGQRHLLDCTTAYSIPPRIPGPFVITFPSLSHFGLLSMLASPDLLDGLAVSPSKCLQSPSLARHSRVSLTGWKVRTSFVSALAACCITEPSLHGYIIIPSPMSAEDLHDVFTRAPCLASWHAWAYLALS